MTDQHVADVVSRAWRSVLGCDEDSDADFFRLGGTSLSVLMLAERIKSELGVEFPLASLFVSGRLSVLIAMCQEEVRKNEDLKGAADS